MSQNVCVEILPEQAFGIVVLQPWGQLRRQLPWEWDGNLEEQCSCGSGYPIDWRQFGRVSTNKGHTDGNASVVEHFIECSYNRGYHFGGFATTSFRIFWWVTILVKSLDVVWQYFFYFLFLFMKTQWMEKEWHCHFTDINTCFFWCCTRWEPIDLIFIFNKNYCGFRMSRPSNIWLLELLK